MHKATKAGPGKDVFDKLVRSFQSDDNPIGKEGMKIARALSGKTNVRNSMLALKSAQDAAGGEDTPEVREAQSSLTRSVAGEALAYQTYRPPLPATW